jgi:hypothetical protein
LRDERIKPPVALYMIYGATSNVFSTSTPVMIATKDTTQLEKWLEYEGDPVGEMEGQQR